MEVKKVTIEKGGKREGSGRKATGKGKQVYLSDETLKEIEKIEYPGTISEKVLFATYTMNARKKMCITCKHQNENPLSVPCLSCEDYKNYNRGCLV